MDVSLTNRQDRYCGPKIDATWHGLWGCNGFAVAKSDNFIEKPCGEGWYF